MLTYPTLPIPGHGELPHYDVCLPVTLRADADRLIRYLHELPYRRVRYCPWCSSSAVDAQSVTQSRLPRYRCRSCRKTCNSLSGTPFANKHRVDLWATFAVYLLAGWSSVQVASRLGMAHKVFFNWGNAVQQAMTEECPDLFQWWTRRQSRENTQPAEHIANQQKAVLNWIETILTTRQGLCPKCGGTKTYRQQGLRPKFKCDPCVTCFSLTSGTPLSGMIRADLWIDFAAGVMDGLSVPDLKRRSGLGMGACTRWRGQFLLLIEELGHQELLQWITWMRSRRNNEAVRFVHNGGYLDKGERSIYPQGRREGKFKARSTHDVM